MACIPFPKPGTMLWLALCVAGTVFGTVQAQNLAEGMEKYREKDYAAALGIVEPLAHQGLPQAQYQLGEMLFYGWGVPYDHAKAIPWYFKAAQQGHAEAQFWLGGLYAGTKQASKPDFTLSSQWYLKAAEQGHVGAQFSIARHYETGLGVEPDEAKATAWYLKAAQQGHAAAKNDLCLRQPGQPLCTDNPTWRQEFDAGLDQFNQKEYAGAFNTWQRLAQQGRVTAQFNVAVMLRDGLGVGQDPVQAFEWMHRAAQHRFVAAQYNLGLMYRDGQGVNADALKAAEWVRKAAEQGDAKAQFELGVMYEDGIGVPQDRSKAVERWSRAAQQGHAEAKNRLCALQPGHALCQ